MIGRDKEKLAGLRPSDRKSGVEAGLLNVHRKLNFTPEAATTGIGNLRVPLNPDSFLLLGSISILVSTNRTRVFIRRMLHWTIHLMDIYIYIGTFLKEERDWNKRESWYKNFLGFWFLIDPLKVLNIFVEAWRVDL